MLIYDEYSHFKNTPLENRFFKTAPLAAAMGAEVTSLQLIELNDDSFEALVGALYHHKMLYLRGQSLTPKQQESFTLRFGPFGTDAYTKGLPDNPNVQPVVKESGTKSKMVFGGGWHTDSPFLQQPPSVSCLYAVETPPYGGDTIWYNSAMAYENLSGVMKNMLAPLRVHMSGETVVKSIQGLRPKTPDGDGKSIGDMALDLDTEDMIKGSFHPLVRTHPVSGEKALYVDKVYAKGVEGMPAYESAPLIDFLVRHITQEVFSCRLRWAAGTFVMWDNRLCLHRAFNDYDGFRREMRRTTVMGETPA